MYLYHSPNGDVSEQNVMYIALRILEDRHAKHQIQVNTGEAKPWREVEAIMKEVKRLQSGYDQCEYIGPDIVGTMKKEEVVARIVEKPAEPHLVREIKVLHGKISQWTSWRDLWKLYQEVAAQIPEEAHSFVRKKHAFVPNTRVYFGEKRTQFYYLSRDKALSIFTENNEEGKDSFDPTRIRRKKRCVGFKALYGWGGIDSYPVWNHHSFFWHWVAVRNHLIDVLRSEKVLRIPGIGTIRYTEEKKYKIAFRILPSFSKKLNGMTAVTKDNIISSDGEHNFSYWLPYVDDRKKSGPMLSNLRRLSLLRAHSDIPLNFLIIKHLCEFVAYHLLLGYHISIPHFGQFRLRKSSKSAAGRTVRFRAHKELLVKLEGGEET